MYVSGFASSGSLVQDVARFLLSHGQENTLQHCLRVAQSAVELAARFGVEVVEAERAALLHDVGVIVPRDEKVAFSQRWGLPVLPEEQQYPGILHQQHSAVFAREVFAVGSDRVLSAISCHTTLKADASKLDKVVFLADKVSWDQDGVPPFLASVVAELDSSLDAGCLAYINWLLGPAGGIVVVHPWLLAAKRDLSAVVSASGNRGR